MAALRYARRADISSTHGPTDTPGIISFAGGLAYPDDLPDMEAFARQAVTAFRKETLQYAPNAGLPALREWLVGFLAEDDVRVGRDNILIVNGAKHGLDLVCKLFVEPGDAVVVTSPTYMSALTILQGYEVTFVEVGQDAEGLNVTELEDRLRDRERAGAAMPKLIFDVPDFHNPTAITMSQRRRQALVALAERYGILIVEDDPYRRLRFEGVPVPPIKSFDRSACVIGLGTFAKLVAPGLRVGWVTATEDIIRRMAILKSDGGSCPLTQRIILEFCKAGQLEPHVRALVKTYTGQRDVMVAQLREQLPGSTCRVPQGGYYLWLQLPEHIDCDRLLPIALRHGVKYYPASTFYATRGPANYMRLAFSFAGPDQIVEGVRRLGKAVAELTTASAG